MGWGKQSFRSGPENPDISFLGMPLRVSTSPEKLVGEV